jgi:signal peptidase I
MNRQVAELNNDVAVRTKKKAPPRPSISSGRESVESFVFVFLFFLVLGIAAEPFVIPTGSMAPTLMGRHKEVTCPECGFVFTVNADREIGDSSGRQPAPAVVEAGTCVNCRFQTRITDDPNFQGDRIYVMKTPLSVPFLSDLAVRLARWDVAVFKLPEEPEVRYIKRLVGMPGEVVRILRGDIWVGPPGGAGPFQRATRPLKHQEGMQILVHDDVHRAKSLTDPRWLRWTGPWDEPAPGVHGAPKETREWMELRYRHVVPDPLQWAAISEHRELPHPPRATLITDFYSYNTDLTAEARREPYKSSRAWRQPHWVGDLTFHARLQVNAPKGKLRLELVKAGVPNRCEIDLATGMASLRHGDEPLGAPSPTGINAAGTYNVSFANVDDRLTLKVDGRVPFGEGVSFEVPPGGPVAPTALDLAPVALGVQGADLSVSGLSLTRDIYYTLEPTRADLETVELSDPLPTDPVALFDWLADPSKFASFAKLGWRDYEIAPGRYMMLGDNSPWSRDGRAWQRIDQVSSDHPAQGWDDSGRESWEVPESLLIGKAFCVYWPHAKPIWPAIRIGKDFRVPMLPYFAKMRWIR